MTSVPLWSVRQPLFVWSLLQRAALYFTLGHVAWGSRPPMNLLYHLYFLQGREFSLPLGQFPHWALLAPEDGSFTYELDGIKGRIEFGQILFCPPHHAFHRHIEGAMTYHIIGFEADPSAQPDVPVGAVTVRDTLRLSSTFRHLRDLSERDSPFIASARNHLLRDLVYLVEKEKHDEPPAAPSKIVDHSMMTAKYYIEERAFTNFSLRQIADLVRLTPVQLTRRFRQAFGQTPVQYLTSLRLAKARALLIQSDLPLRQIAHQCGFNSEHYLSRVFFEATGLRPGKFREIRRF